jgi:hypothetical protein
VSHTIFFNVSVAAFVKQQTDLIFLLRHFAMQRTSSCGQLDLLRKAFTTLDTQVRRRDGLTAAAAELGTQLPRRAFYSTPSVAGGITALRKTVLSDGIVQLDQLHKMAEDLQLREKKLELGPELQLFDWPTVNQPTKALTDSRMIDLCIPKPLGPAKLVMADLYEKKYGVLICCTFDGHDADSVLDGVIKKIRNADEKPVGFIVPARRPEEWVNAANYRGHVVPMIIQQTNTGFDVINLDSLANNSEIFQNFLQLFQVRIDLTGTSILRSCLVKNRRQSDSQSCHTDALQVLKDALHALKHGENRSAYSLFMQNELATKTGSEMPRFLLPSFLQKTNQRNRALVHDHFDGASQLQPPRFDLLFSDKSVLIGQHRYKYLGMLGIKQCNNFLTIKAYYNAQKVLAHLADFTDSNARELYLMQLQEVRDSGDLGVSGER